MKFTEKDGPPLSPLRSLLCVSWYFPQLSGCPHFVLTEVRFCIAKYSCSKLSLNVCCI